MIKHATAFEDEPSVAPLAVDPMMAQAFGNQIRASKRQIQLWTDHGILKCLPGTDHQGRGHKRIYDAFELPIGSLVVVLARFKFTVGILQEYADVVRNLLHENEPASLYERRERGWFRGAFRGSFNSWMGFIPELTKEYIPGETEQPQLSQENRLVFFWEDERTLTKGLHTRRAITLISVTEVISPFVR